jgi:predicted PurR-regulated permease PerM
MQNNRWFQALVVLLVIIASFYLVGQVWFFLAQFFNLILLFFLAWLLAFILRPLARSLSAGGMPYTLAVFFVYVVLAVLFTLAGLLLVPIVTQQVAQLINNFNGYVSDIAQLVDNVQKMLISWGVRDVDINKFYSDLAGQIQTIGMSILQNTFTVLQSVANLVFQLVLVLIFSFYFMKDGERIFGNARRLLPPAWQDEARLLAMSIERSFGGFVRGQLLFALLYTFLTAAVMLIFQLDYVVIASIVAGLCMIIPLVGNFLAFAPPILVCLVTKPDVWIPLFLVLFAMQAVAMNVVGPRIMSQAIGIHPLYVMGAMLVGGQVAGLWGALFGIPIAGVINLVGRPLMRRMRYSASIYRENPVGRLTTADFATGPLAIGRLEPSSTVEEVTEPPLPVRPAPVAAEAAPLETLPDDDEDEEPAPYPLTVVLWRLAWSGAARLYRWVGARARARTSQH